MDGVNLIWKSKLSLDFQSEIILFRKTWTTRRIWWIWRYVLTPSMSSDWGSLYLFISYYTLLIKNYTFLEHPRQCDALCFRERYLLPPLPAMSGLTLNTPCLKPPCLTFLALPLLFNAPCPSTLFDWGVAWHQRTLGQFKHVLPQCNPWLCSGDLLLHSSAPGTGTILLLERG